MIDNLRLVVQNRLNSIKTEYGLTEISYRKADNKNLYPHIVYYFTSITPADMGRSDIIMDIDIWTRDPKIGFAILESCRELFAFCNSPNDSVLPTFYEISGGEIDDPDEEITHIVLRLEVQVYEVGVTDSGILGKE